MQIILWQSLIPIVKLLEPVQKDLEIVKKTPRSDGFAFFIKHVGSSWRHDKLERLMRSHKDFSLVSQIMSLFKSSASN